MGKGAFLAQLAALTLAVGSAQAGPLEDGLAAYKKGDYSQAMQRWQPLAANGDPDAQFWLGALYDQGRGVPQSHETAARLYLKAAEQGQANAQFNLGLLYTDGLGVVQDYVQAHMWINLAASVVKGDDQKKFAKVRDMVTVKMSAEQIAEAQRRAREWKPIRQGDW